MLEIKFLTKRRFVSLNCDLNCLKCMCYIDFFKTNFYGCLQLKIQTQELITKQNLTRHNVKFDKNDKSEQNALFEKVFAKIF